MSQDVFRCEDCGAAPAPGAVAGPCDNCGGKFVRAGKMHDVFEERASHFNQIALRFNQQVAVGAIVAERKRQDKKWGEIDSFANRTPEQWLAILTEENGELAQSMLPENCGGPPAAEQVACMRLEAIHVAAVALSIIEWLDLKRDAVVQAEAVGAGVYQ